MWPMNHRLRDTDYISDSWEQHSQHSLWPFNLEWQNMQFFAIFLKLWLNNQHLSHLCIFWLEVSMTKVPQTLLPGIQAGESYYTIKSHWSWIDVYWYHTIHQLKLFMNHIMLNTPFILIHHINISVHNVSIAGGAWLILAGASHNSAAGHHSCEHSPSPNSSGPRALLVLR